MEGKEIIKYIPLQQGLRLTRRKDAQIADHY